VQNFFTLELVAAMHDGDVVRNIGEVQRLFDGRIAAADHRDILALVEEAVAGRTSRYTLARKPCSLGMPRYFALAPVVMISASQV